MKIALLGSLFALVFVGCSTKVDVVSLQPAKAKGVSNFKTLSILPFKKDNVGLSKKIESDLTNYKIDGKNYFTVLEVDKKRITDEHYYRESGVYGSELSENFEDLKGAKAFVSGEVLVNEVRSRSSKEKREECADAKCKKKKTVYVKCVERDAKLEALIKIIDITTSKIIFSEVYRRDGSWKKCGDSYVSIPSIFSIPFTFAEEISRGFLFDIVPSYKTEKVTLLDEEDIDYSDKAEKLLEDVIDLIDENRLEKAEEFLKDLINETKRQSYVALYNLGVLKEAKGEYSESKSLYKNAQTLTKEPIKEIDRAVIRIQKLISAREEAKKEITAQ